MNTCPAKEWDCKRCGKKGHIAKKCSKKGDDKPKKVHQVVVQDNVNPPGNDDDLVDYLLDFTI